MAPLDGHKLLAFLTVAREGGFSRAARTLGRTQSSVSEAVAQLESELGRRLFHRDARRTLLTDEGRVLLEHAERILDEMQSARARLAEVGGGPLQGELVVGTSDTLACHLLPPLFAAFRRAHPTIQLRLDNRPSPEVALEVRERRLALGIVSLPLPLDAKVGGRPLSEGLNIEPSTRYSDVVLLPPGHPLATRGSLRLQQLVREPLLLLDRSTGSRALIERAFQRLGQAPNVVMEAKSVDVLIRLVELEFGVSIVPSIAVHREVRSGSVCAAPLRGLGGPALPGEQRAVGLVTHSRAPLPSAARAFLELARSTLPDKA